MGFPTIFFGFFFGLYGLVVVLLLRRRPVGPPLAYYPRVSIW